MALARRVWSVGKILVLCGAWLATYFVFAGVAMRVTLQLREVPVPELRGRSVADAAARAAAVGLTVAVEPTKRVDANIPPGAVVAQEPEAGVRLRRQRPVRVWLSAGARAATVPALVGETPRAAVARLNQSGLTLVETAEIRSRQYPGGTVVAQNPPPDREGAAVALLVNLGEGGPSFVMPDLVGFVGERAAELMRARGFRVAIVGEVPYPGVPRGIVLRHQPAAGFRVAPGELVSLEVSR
jgi:beta-lactam-binding protein with PASTA domain